MLRAALKQISSTPQQLLAAADITETARAEELTIEQFCTLARALAAEGMTREETS